MRLDGAKTMKSGVLLAMLTVAACGPADEQAEATQLGTNQAQLIGDGVCGSGYEQIAHIPFRNLNDVIVGHYNLYYNANTGKNCGVNQASPSNYGTALFRRVEIGRLNDPASVQVDEGTYKYYAGPVYVYA